MSADIAAVRNELEDLARVIAVTEVAAQEASDPFAWELSLQGLRARREQLRAELATQLRDTETAEVFVRVGGRPVQGPTADVGFLAGLLGALQHLVSALAQTIAAKPTVRGSINGNIMGRTALRVARLMPGSFQMQLLGDASPDVFGESLLEQALQRLHDLVEAGDNASRLAELLGPWGLRVENRYADLLDTVVSNEADVEFSTCSCTAQPRTATLSAPSARGTRAALNLLRREIVRTERVRGRLVGLMKHHSDFEFEDAETGEVVNGKVLPEVMAQVLEWFNQDVGLVLEVDATKVAGRDDLVEHRTLLEVLP